MVKQNIFNFENSNETNYGDEDENEFILDTDKILNSAVWFCLKVINLFENSLEFSEMRKNMYL